MPLYEYQCDTCAGRFERIRKFSDPPLDEPCPTCGGPIRKLISSPAIQFKGSGFYITDYAKAGSSEASRAGSASAEATADAKSDSKKSDAKASAGTEGKSESKSESAKPAAATETKTATPTDKK